MSSSNGSSFGVVNLVEKYADSVLVLVSGVMRARAPDGIENQHKNAISISTQIDYTVMVVFGNGHLVFPRNGGASAPLREICD